MCTNRSRGWVFTWNNAGDDDDDYCQELINNDSIRYICYGREVGDSGTPHLQGYLYFNHPRTFTGVKKLLKHCHIEIQKGTCDEAIQYCKKDGDYFETGHRPISQQEKGDAEKENWEEARKLLLEDKLEEIPARFMKYWPALMRYKAHMESRRELEDLSELKNYWFYGNTGTGKSKSARRIFNKAYDKACSKWWDGYQFQDAIIIDDIDPKSGAWMGTLLKRWSDHYPFPAEFKGGSMKIRPKTIIVTSNYSIEEIWPDEPQTTEPLTRRFIQIYFNTGTPTSVTNMIYAAEALAQMDTGEASTQVSSPQ